MTFEIMDRVERAALSLRELYAGFGYVPYKMSKFEPYDFYAENRSFVTGENILTFTDTNGRLMALKPDVTLSIIKNYKGGQEKVYYNENVYREGGSSHEFTEIVQTGLECIGKIDLYAEYEVLSLAADSLMRLSGECILDIASVGFISGLMSATDAEGTVKRQLLGYIQAKNAHNIRSLCAKADIAPEVSAVWERLAVLYCTAKDARRELEPLCLNDEMKKSCDELSALAELFGDTGVSLNLDFSIVSDLVYYNGLVFKGYIAGAHESVLSGGRYDNLAGKLGKKAQAIGFAVYLDLLKQLGSMGGADRAETLIVYRTGTDPRRVMDEVTKLRAGGIAVRAEAEPCDTDGYRRVIRL